MLLYMVQLWALELPQYDKEYVTAIEIIGLECEVYCSHNHGIVNMCGGNMAAQWWQESGSCKCVFLPNP